MNSNPVPISRPCTRCEGAQLLIDFDFNMGVYECDSCYLRIGFDLESYPPEFLIHRGHPWEYEDFEPNHMLTAEELRIAGVLNIRTEDNVKKPVTKG